MELKEKAISLAEELGIDFGEVHRVIGVSASTLEAAFNGHKKAFDSVTKFFTDREAAFQQYTAEQIEIIKKFEKFVTEPENGSASKAAEKIGIGSAVISGLRKGTYNGINEKYFSELAAYFKIKQEKSELPDIFTPLDYVPTTISQMIYQRLRNVHVLGGCAVITGDAGIGKTKTIQKYANNDVLEGIRNTATALQTGKIKICDCCASSLAEFSAYRWNEKSGNDAPIKENDHAMDDIRYFVNTVLYNKGGFFVDVR